MRASRPGDGWSVAVGYDGSDTSPDVGWADVSHLGKLEVAGAPGPDLVLGTARRDGDVWWLPIRRDRTLVVGPAAAVREARSGLDDATALDVTTVFAAMAIAARAAAT